MKFLVGTLATIAILICLALSVAWHESRKPESVALDPLWVVRKFNDALNSRDLAGAMTLFADPVTLTDPSGQIISDRDSLRGWLQTELDHRDQSELSDIWLKGDTVSWTVRVSKRNLVRQSQITAVVHGGKFVAFIAHQPEDCSRPCAGMTPKTSGEEIVWCSNSEMPDEIEFDSLNSTCLMH